MQQDIKKREVSCCYVLPDVSFLGKAILRKSVQLSFGVKHFSLKVTHSGSARSATFSLREVNNTFHPEIYFSSYNS